MMSMWRDGDGPRPVLAAILIPSLVAALSACDVFGMPSPLQAPAVRPAALMVQRPAPLRLHAGEHGPIHVADRRFVDEDGRTWVWRGVSAFRLYEQWLNRVDIDPMVADWITCGGLCRAGQGPNVLRVFGTIAGWARLIVRDHPDYYDQLGPFVDRLGTRFGVRVEFVIFADTTQMPDPADRLAHARRVAQALSGKWNVFVEVANEPNRPGNLPGGGAAAHAIGEAIRPLLGGVLAASGDYDIPRDALSFHHLDFVTHHPGRDDEWPRRMKDLQDMRDGFDRGGGRAAFQGVRVPVVADEPIGFDERERPGVRTTSADDAAWAGALCVMAGAGCTFHSQAGREFAPLGPKQKAASAAWFAAMAWVPPDAQRWSYQRGDRSGGPGVGDMPIVDRGEPQTTGTLRTYCKGNGSSEWCVAIRPGPRWTAQARDGWRILDRQGPRGTLIRLEK